MAKLEYSDIIGESWRLTWRHRSLWVLGLFAGSGGGASANVNLPGGGSSPATPGRAGGAGGATGSGEDLGLTPEQVQAGMAQALDALARNAGLLVFIGIFILALFLVFFALGSACQAGMAAGTVRLGRGDHVTLGEAWREGLRFFWRFVGLNLIQVVIGLVVLVLTAGAILASLGAIFRGMGVPGTEWLPSAGGFGALAVLGFLLAIVLSVLSTIVLGYAQRAVPARDAGPIEALGEGWRLFRGAMGTGIVLWLLQVALGIGFGIAFVLGLVVLAIPLVLIGVLIGAAAGTGALLIAYAVIAGLIALAAIWIVSAGSSTFQWHFWTQAYLRLTGEIAARADTVAPPAAAPAREQPFPRLN